MTYFAYTIGIVSLVATAIWFAHETSFEPFVTLLGGILALIKDFVDASKKVRWKEDELNLYKFQAIKEIAKRHNISTTKKKKRDLIVALTKVHKSSSQYLNLKRFFILVLGIVVFIVSLELFPPKKFVIPNLSIRFYKTEQGQISLLPEYAIPFDISFNDFINNRIRIPIQIALKSEQSERLVVHKVEITYPPGVQLNSTGNAQVDPKNRTLIYTHDLEYIDDVEYYSPLKTIDTLIYGLKFSASPYVIYDKTGIPSYFIGFMSTSMFVTHISPRVDFKVKIYFDKYEAFTQTFTLTLQVPFQGFTDTYSDSISYDVNYYDNSLFNVGSLESQNLIDFWSRQRENGDEIKYYKLEIKGSMCQYVFINNILVKVNVDENKDGLTDYTMINENGDKTIDFKYIMKNSTPMMDWKADKFK